MSTLGTDGFAEFEISASQIGMYANNDTDYASVVASASLVGISASGVVTVESDTEVRLPSVLNIMLNLPVYADDAAATTGGLAEGAIYRTSGGELRIKLPDV